METKDSSRVRKRPIKLDNYVEAVDLPAKKIKKQPQLNNENKATVVSSKNKSIAKNRASERASGKSKPSTLEGELHAEDEKNIATSFAINDSRLRRKAVKELPRGPSEELVLSDAIEKGVKGACRLLTNFQSVDAAFIGKLCKVYWDGENEWFYGRILNYDPINKMHFIYYSIDSTAEWLDIHKEPVVVCTELVAARSLSFPPWPACRYEATSAAALKQLALFPKQKQNSVKVEDCVFVEFFGNSFESRECAFVNPKSDLFPLEVALGKDTSATNKKSKRFKIAVIAAKSEQSEFSSLLEVSTVLLLI